MKPYYIIGIIICCLISGAIVQAELTPNQVGIIAVVSSPESQDLARFYANARQIPADNILSLPINPGGAISRDQWEKTVRPAIRNWLNSSPQRRNIRCLVTTYDCPQVVAGVDVKSDVEQRRQQSLNQLWQEKLQRAAILTAMFNSIAAPTSAEITLFPPTTTFEEATQKLQEALKSAQKRILALSPEDQKTYGLKLQKVFLSAAGVKGVLQNIVQQAKEISDDLKLRQALATAEIKGTESILSELQCMRGTETRDWLMVRNLDRLAGCIGSLQWLDSQRKLISQNETMAAFDSELVFIHLPDHSLERWLPNPLFYGTRDSLKSMPVMMVARLEAPSVEIVKKRISEGLEAEKNGLAGKIYLDARANRIDGEYQLGSYEKCDQSICLLNKRLKEHTNWEVVLNDDGSLFPPDSCPDTALYVGWYALNSYVPAFKWNPGSIGYHLASLEANSIRSSGSKAWCTGILENGGAATVGPLFEPYLSAFPMPEDFYSLLLTGKYTLAEAYALTTPFASWSMILIGDPLYNPYKATAPLKTDDLPDAIKTGLKL